MHLWPGAQVLAEFVHSHLECTEKNIVEFGAGTALPGLTAALSGARKVYLTDSNGAALANCAQAIEWNGLQGSRVETVSVVVCGL